MSMVRRRRVEQSEENRRAILSAARAQFENNGFHGASLDVIADEAGFSKGAVYSRFTSKDDLFLAVIEEHIERRAAATAAQVAELDSYSVELADVARLGVRASVESVAWQAALMEFRAHAFRNPEVNRRYGELHRRTIASIGSFIAEVFERRGETMPLPADQMACLALANSMGLVAEYMTDPDIDVDRLVQLSVTGMAGHATGLAAAEGTT